MSIQRQIFQVLRVDGTEFEDVEPILADKNGYGKLARRHGWGSMTEDPMQFANYAAWRCLKRTGRIGDESWDEFNENTVLVTMPGDELEDVAPFRG